MSDLDGGDVEEDNDSEVEDDDEEEDEEDEEEEELSSFSSSSSPMRCCGSFIVPFIYARTRTQMKNKNSGKTCNFATHLSFVNEQGMYIRTYIHVNKHFHTLFQSKKRK